VIDKAAIRAKAQQLVAELPFPLADPGPELIEAALIQVHNEAIEAAAEWCDGYYEAEIGRAIRRLRIEDND